MYIAMNRFRINSERTGEFETVWKNRNSYLHEVPGFESFRLLRGPSDGGVTVYVSHSTWADEAAFIAWTESEAFRKAHSTARSPEGVVLGPPKFEGFDVVLTA
jgi:heme-degrading monooxygenase HmoA